MITGSPDLSDLRYLCKKYGVKFAIETNGEDVITYCFGDIRWQVFIDNDFNLEAYLEVMQRLAAKYPDKVYNT